MQGLHKTICSVVSRADSEDHIPDKGLGAKRFPLLFRDQICRAVRGRDVSSLD
jgi:hypothetical protein